MSNERVTLVLRSHPPVPPKPPAIFTLPTEILDVIFKTVVEPPTAAQHSEQPRESEVEGEPEPETSSQILKICLTCKRFFAIAGSSLYGLCVISYLKSKETPVDWHPWSDVGYSVFVSPQELKPGIRDRDYLETFLKAAGCIRTLQIGSAESLFTYPRGSRRPIHSTATLPNLLEKLSPKLSRLTALTLDRSFVDYGLPLDHFFRSLHLLFTRCPTIEKLTLSISYCEHESRISTELFQSTLSCGQNPCFRYPVLKELNLTVHQKTNYLSRDERVRLWPLELLGIVLNFSSKSITKLAFSCSACCPYDLFLEKNKRVPLSYIFNYDLVPDYADFRVDTKKWDMPAVKHVVLDIDLDSLKGFDRYLGVTLANVETMEFNLRKDDRWHRVIREVNLGSFPSLKDLKVNSFATARETGRFLHCLDREANMQKCESLSSTDVEVHPNILYVSDCQEFLENVRGGYGPCSPCISKSCRPQSPSWKVLF
ncbi:hypothetical protein TWF718_007271 [Orbilia javanica]|uniref:F-box domain-containing protein n=1 Tax=Orbilia javanica TaxID=47235 RepID=A0AAN8MY08_9PEZI